MNTAQQLKEQLNNITDAVIAELPNMKQSEAEKILNSVASMKMILFGEGQNGYVN